MGDYVHMRPSDGECEVHDWPTSGMAPKLFAAMRERHGKGGISVCLDCIRRAKKDAKQIMEAKRRS